MNHLTDILVVDDEIEIVRMLSDILSDEGYVVRAARDGHAAISEIASACPQLVLLDYSMPGMTGAELAAYLRAVGHIDLPLVLMSAGTRLDGLKISEVNDTLPKPFDFDQLLSTVKRHTHKLHGAKGLVA